MLSPNQDVRELYRLCEALLSIPKEKEIFEPIPPVAKPDRKMSVREAVLSVSEEVSIHDALGRVVASLSVSCPPAIPIAVSGEVIDGDVINAFEYYKIDRVRVVK
jgi:arginine/lysine/ornithine decarboxylase